METTKIFTWGLLLVFGSLISCSEEDGLKITSNEEVSVENEATTDSYFEETDDFSVLTVSSDDATFSGGKSGIGGRRIFIPDNRLECAEIEIEVADESTPEMPKGMITIDFGDGCEDNRGNVRKGKIIVNYTGRRFLPGSIIVTTFDGYSINEVHIEGVRTVTNANGSLEENPKFNIVVEGGKATWPDGTFATREANRTREWFRAANPLNDEWHVSGNAAGVNRNGVAYTMEITAALVYKRQCAVLNRIFMAVEGVKVLTTANRQMTIDYGDGECDRLVTITVNGETKELEITGDV